MCHLLYKFCQNKLDFNLSILVFTFWNLISTTIPIPLELMFYIWYWFAHMLLYIFLISMNQMIYQIYLLSSYLTLWSWFARCYMLFWYQWINWNIKYDFALKIMSCILISISSYITFCSFIINESNQISNMILEIMLYILTLI